MAAKMFRMILQVGDVERATNFYARLLAADGRLVGGGRIYFDVGPMILAILKPEKEAVPIAEPVYFAVDDLEAVHARARELGALSSEELHGAEAGAIVRRPWGERSFYAFDPWANPLCFVDETTVFTGKRS